MTQNVFFFTAVRADFSRAAYDNFSLTFGKLLTEKLARLRSSRKALIFHDLKRYFKKMVLLKISLMNSSNYDTSDCSTFLMLQPKCTSVPLLTISMK